MRSWPPTRLAAAGGLLAVVLFVVANFIAGESPPKFNATPDEIASYFGDHHRALLISSLLYGVVAPLFLALVAVLTRLIRARGHGDLGTIAFAGGVAAMAIGAVGDAIGAALTLVAPVDPQLGRGLYRLSGFVYGRLFWVALALVIPVGLAAWRGALPRWQAWLSAAAAALFALGGISVKGAGAFSPTGVFPLLGFLGLLVWIVGVSIALWRVEEPAEVPLAAPTTV
jgi:hypothetical protein